MKKCSECKHAHLRFNNGAGATTCGLLNDFIVVYGFDQDFTPPMCPYLADPEPVYLPAKEFNTVKLTKENFHEIVKPGRMYTSYVCYGNDWRDSVGSKFDVVWKLFRVVETEDDAIIFEVKTIEEAPRRIVMATNGDGWFREVREVEVNNDSEDL